MKLNFIHNGSGVVNAIQRAINELAEWHGVQHDPDVNAAMKATDGILRRALQNIRDLQDGRMPAPEKRFILSCVNEDVETVSVRAFPTLAAAQAAMKEQHDYEVQDALDSGYEGFITNELREDCAAVAYGDTCSYTWAITEVTI